MNYDQCEPGLKPEMQLVEITFEFLYLIANH
jgi:hypothetical protein